MFSLIAGISAGASAGIVLLLLLGPFLKKRYPAKWRYFLWIAVCIFSLLPLNLLLPRSAPFLSFTLPERSITLGLAAQPNNGNLNQPQTQQGNTAQAEGTEALVTEGTPETIATTHPPVTLSLTLLFTAIWILGLLLYLLNIAAKYIAFTKVLKRQNIVPASPDTLAVFQRLKEEI